MGAKVRTDIGSKYQLDSSTHKMVACSSSAVFFYDSKLDLIWTFSSHGKEGHHPHCASRLALL
jgi:hypothetical protein